MVLKYGNNPNKSLGLWYITSSMKFSDYISHHQVFTTAELMACCDSPTAAEEQLRLAVRSGYVERVRRGLLVSNYGRFEGAAVDPFAVVMAADGNAVVSYHSACEMHGVAHNVSFACQFRSNRVKTPFTFRGVDYTPCGSVGDTMSKLVRSGDASVRVATREQTIVDCLDRPGLAGGAEEAVRSVSAFAYIDSGALLGIVRKKSPATASRVGWLLSSKVDDWHVADETLDELRSMLGNGPYRLGKPGAEGSGWSRDWNLVLPEPNEEVATWVTKG
jgi:predicted transcriptional regulator of viral defense system